MSLGACRARPCSSGCSRGSPGRARRSRGASSTSLNERRRSVSVARNASRTGIPGLSRRRITPIGQGGLDAERRGAQQIAIEPVAGRLGLARLQEGSVRLAREAPRLDMPPDGDPHRALGGYALAVAGGHGRGEGAGAQVGQTPARPAPRFARPWPPRCNGWSVQRETGPRLSGSPCPRGAPSAFGRATGEGERLGRPPRRCSRRPGRPRPFGLNTVEDGLKLVHGQSRRVEVVGVGITRDELLGEAVGLGAAGIHLGGAVARGVGVIGGGPEPTGGRVGRSRSRRSTRPTTTALCWSGSGPMSSAHGSSRS